MPSQDESAKGSLYVVATPIGNLGDITLRALEVLKSVAAVAAEDTRNTARLLGAYSISTRTVPLHQHNERQMSEKILAMLAAGDSVALVSDAGTPAISDPGNLLVKSAIDSGFRVIPIPGANAAVTALCASGMGEKGFLFHGFLPAKGAQRRQVLESLQAVSQVLVFYEAPHRILELAADLGSVFGSAREIVIARELTKCFESIYRCKASEALAWLEADPNRQKGEFVVLIEQAPEIRDEQLSEPAKKTLKLLLAELPLKQAVKLAAEISGESRNRLYELALELKKP